MKWTLTAMLLAAAVACSPTAPPADAPPPTVRVVPPSSTPAAPPTSTRAPVAAPADPAPAPPDAPAEPAADALRALGESATVERVVDGDTLAVTLTDGTPARVRLLTIDAPELRQRSTPADDECGAQAAADALADRLPPGTPVVLATLKGEPETDRYERLLRNVYVLAEDPAAPPLNVSWWLAEAGWAAEYDDYPTSDSERVQAAEDRARAAGLGIWGLCG